MALERDWESGQDQKRCLAKLLWAVEQLGGAADAARLGKTAALVIQTMTGPWRFFHTPEHIFEVGESGDAIEVLAALFHDLVYVQVDQGVSVNISGYISAFVKEITGQLVIRDRTELPDDPMLEMVMQLFGFVPEEVLKPTAGQNEFLSAVIAAKSLEQSLVAEQIAEVVACIEATIPFRSLSESGLSPSERLYARLQQTATAMGFGWRDEQVAQIVRRSVRLANRDVENFAYPAAADFLDNTWNLLPETNHDLTNANSYTVSGYRVSLQKMEGFMYFLKPELVFQQFQSEPSVEIYQQLIVRTQRNLDVARLYLGSKLLSIAVIEALSQRLGQDIPLATMMGELSSHGRSMAQLENFLPQLSMTVAPETDIEEDVLSLVEKGRGQSSSYDIKNSPVATYLIKSVGFPETRRLLVHAKEFFKETLTPEAFLAMCDRAVVETITNGILEVFESRKIAMRGPECGK
ncbi:hypothetical protein [Stenomitos frigidus]|uniref:Uncharacterized protein n=1 Tax=Stenomitos frigidus ULC18 TaxID=2107698 RepID=A0A2T1EL35_9CYAN|nr:hypothetical protein [Stenomitos frigidus]PSB33421.1 hypothetical protein C7B82_04560 [Stenomitos frigidus ULC18]